MKTRQRVKEAARDALSKQHTTAALISLVVIMVGFMAATPLIVVSLIFGEGLLYWLMYGILIPVLGVFQIGVYGEFIKVWNHKKAGVNELFLALAVNFWRKLGGTLWQTFWVVLWTLPFSIAIGIASVLMPILELPFLIALAIVMINRSMAYYFAPNILADCPNVTATQALKISIHITSGRRMELFIFALSWLGWQLLSILTCGVLWIVYIGPYWFTADAGLYLDMKKKALDDSVITYDEIGEEPENPLISIANRVYKNNTDLVRQANEIEQEIYSICPHFNQTTKRCSLITFDEWQNAEQSGKMMNINMITAMCSTAKWSKCNHLKNRSN